MSPDAEDASSPETENDQDLDIMAQDPQDRHSSEEKSPGHSSSNDAKPAKSNSKDPSRPRRKKARRACFACQRAHLTCGDERPCNRCIKRGLQDQCHDGVRKKAKYLHDAPAEALMPGFSGTYHVHSTTGLPDGVTAPAVGSSQMSTSPPGNYFGQPSSASFQRYGSLAQQSPMAPAIMENTNTIGDFTSQSAVRSPGQYQSTPSQQLSPVQQMNDPMEPPSTMRSAGSTSFDVSFVDPSDPALFDFNISDFNFGNHYGALEFGMLGHMSSGAVGTPEVDVMRSMGNQGSMSFDGTIGFPSGFGYDQNFQSWQQADPGSRQGSVANLWGVQTNGMDAFAVGEHSAPLTGTSPHSQNQDFSSTAYPSNTASSQMPFTQADQSQQSGLPRRSISQSQQYKPKKSPFPTDPIQTGLKNRRRDTSEIYSSVESPYPYTQAFHALTAFLQSRYPSKKVLRIAKALAAIRPSFISCNKNLNHDDLIFMEKCFQRTLVEYEEFINHYGTPTIICRRTGEIAAVSKEFSLVTGWRRDVLLGKEPNLNVNTGGGRSGTHTGSSSRGAATPRVAEGEINTGRPQPVFLAELLDEDSVVNFYQDFSELAFGASRGSIIGAPCYLLKYKTKDDAGWGASERNAGDAKAAKKSGDGKNEPLIRGEAGMNALGEADGRVSCAMCWTVKRDMFDIPMLIVMNFLPRI